MYPLFYASPPTARYARRYLLQMTKQNWMLEVIAHTSTKDTNK